MSKERKDGAEPSEPRLIEGLKAGDEACLGQLIESYWDGLLDYSLRIIGDADRAADVVQEAFVELWAGRSGWAATRTVRPLLYRMVRNRSLNQTRSDGTFQEWVSRERASDRDPSPSPLEETEGRCLEAAVDEALASLPERRREIFELVRFHGFSYREAAEALDASPQTVANQVSLAMRDLKRALGRRLSPPETGRPRRSLRLTSG